MELKIEVSELQKRKLFLGVPMYGGQCTGMFARSLADLSSYCTRYQIQLQMYFLFNESLITRARNYICDEFMRSEATHLMFIDSDIGFNPQDVIGLLALASEESPYSVIGGPYPKKCIAWEKIKQAVDKGFADQNPNKLENFVGDYVFNPRSGSNTIPLMEPVEVMEIGTGFMMIKKSTLEKFRDFYPHYHYKPDHVRTEHFDGSREIMAYFDCVIDRGYDVNDIKKLAVDLIEKRKDEHTFVTEMKALIDGEAQNSKRYLSEDYKFCVDVMKMGGSVWLCPWMKLQHVGSYVFGGSLVDLAQLGASATVDMNEIKKIREAEKAERLGQPAIKTKKGSK